MTEEEIRGLIYMTDIESHTIAYLRAILNTCAVEDSQTTAFLSSGLTKSSSTAIPCASFSTRLGCRSQ